MPIKIGFSEITTTACSNVVLIFNLLTKIILYNIINKSININLFILQFSVSFVTFYSKIFVFYCIIQFSFLFFKDCLLCCLTEDVDILTPGLATKLVRESDKLKKSYRDMKRQELAERVLEEQKRVEQLETPQQRKLLSQSGGVFYCT